MADKDPKNDPITVDQVESIARQKLPSNVYNYYALMILPRILRDVSQVDTSVALFQRKFPIPVGIAPSAMQKLAGQDGEMGMAGAAAAMGLNFTLSSNSTTLLEDVASVRTRCEVRSVAPFWFQIYLTTDLEHRVPLIKRAEAAGYEALVLTVDTPVLGNRINERQTPLILPEGIRLENLEPDKIQGTRKPSPNRILMDARTPEQAKIALQEIGGKAHSASLTWESTIKFLRETTKMKIILKGILAPEDAQLAVEYGVDAIIVSNHGGRQLDSVPSTIQALPGVVEAVGGRIPVILDGGIRRGSDLFKALALGADFVLVGRPALWGLAFDGQKGVETVMNILERELTRTMALAGTSNLQEINSSLLRLSVDGRLSKL
ncbi:S-2-hydroxy-acid oxidase [Penicillium cataractarum]|uniref:S-2-hydroxy-acid oxidase n=1 Tax=Penicillium cataractarum TaxID=2100454 RepID=A0A9W9S247_9EURO|nr:S-2-hydroxy-acid oxidase [Penicillium cataractarum]KAJ5370668.1 S-2-hydroxy-acid oxidase [Penicillium cataractarum]